MQRGCHKGRVTRGRGSGGGGVALERVARVVTQGRCCGEWVSQEGFVTKGGVTGAFVNDCFCRASAMIFFFLAVA